MFFGLYMNLSHKDTTNSQEARLAMKKYYKKLVSLFKFPVGKRTLKLQTFPTLNLPITSHQYNKEERLQINFVQVVAPPSPLKKSQCKTSRKLKKIQESFLRLRILINIILIKWICISRNSGSFKKNISNQCAMQHNLSQFVIQKALSLRFQ